MQKKFGLDIVRSIAITLVLLAHLSPFFKNNSILFNLLYHSGLYGVELFFVLSGFLIGQSIMLKISPTFSFKQIKKFYLKRFLRIAPLYYIILSILVLINVLFLNSKSFHLAHFVFLQNFFQSEVGFFAVSWTLSIQFWFYTIVPILFLVINRKKQSKNKMLYSYIFIILILIFIRYLYVSFFNPTFDFGTRKNIFLRFDSLFIGVLFAILKHKLNFLYKKIAHKFFFAISVISLVIFYAFYLYFMMTFGIDFFDKSVFFRVFGWPLISLMLTVSVAYLENSVFINGVLKNKKFIYIFFTKLGAISFSMFLIHYEIYSYFENNPRYNNIAMSIMMSTTIIVALSFLLYNFVEKPILLKKSQI